MRCFILLTKIEFTYLWVPAGVYADADQCRNDTLRVRSLLERYVLDADLFILRCLCFFCFGSWHIIDLSD